MEKMLKEKKQKVAYDLSNKKVLMTKEVRVRDWNRKRVATIVVMTAVLIAVAIWLFATKVN